MKQGSAAGTASRRGYLGVLFGSAAFIASCFIPYYDPGTLPMPLRSLSLFRLMMSFRESELAMTGGFLNLFAGVTIVAWVSIAGLRGHRWAPMALLAVSAAWSLTWIGVLMNLSGFVVRSPLAGYWLILVSIGVVVTGAIVVWISSRANISGTPPGNAVAATQPHAR
ncbi:MAG: hypothetical protein K0R20_408 [Actinomycetia bacterium]|nr:hypothetical protein [Actinomycetes bacterium]